MNVSMLFNGHDFKDEFTILDIRGRGILQNEVETIEVAGKAGAYFIKRKIPIRVLEVDIAITGDNPTDLRHRIREINRILSVDKPKPIVFSDDDEITYNGIPEGSSESEQIVSTSESTIVFVCADPYSYSPEIEHPFEFDVTTVINNGAEEAKPTFELEVLQPITYAMVQNQDNEYQMVGRPISVEEEPTSDQEVILNDNASSLVGWSAMTGGSTLFNLGVIGGSMKSNGYAFLIDQEGTNPNGWVGPAIRRTLTEPLQNFKIEAEIEMRNLGGGVGRIVVLGLDINEDLVFSMGMMDSTNSYANNRALFGLGKNNTTFINYQGDRGRVVWNDARLLLRIERRGNEIIGWIAEKLDDVGAELTGRHRVIINDSRSEYQNKIEQIVIYMAGAKHYPLFPMYFHHLKVTKLIDLSEYEVPYIAEVGDIIVFDHENAEILVNGDDYKSEKDFGGSYFTLKKGENQLVVHPADSFEAKVKYKETYR